MTSQITTTAIDVEYPIAGQDNDSQGFRDNFSNIVAALDVAATEISDLQTRTVVVADTNNDPAVNNLQGSTLSNGLYKNLDGVVFNAGTVTGTTDININNGPLQVFTLSSNTTLRFTNWPATGRYAKVRVHIASDTNGAWLPTLATESGGTIFYEANFPALTLSTDGSHQVIEAWTFTGSTAKNIYVRFIGEFPVT